MVLAILGGAYYIYTKTPIPADVTVVTPAANYKNATYSIHGQNVTLINGTATTEIAPGSASKLVTQYFGNVATGDLNGDGVPDAAFILTQQGGGSGTFYYIVAALKTTQGYQGTNGVLLGDRIAPQTTEIQNGQVIVNYATRNANDSFVVAPSIGVSKYLQVIGTTLKEVMNEDNVIHVSAPTINATVRSLLVITGEAVGTWYFEASFPALLLDANGKVLAQSPAKAQGNWMTTNFVPFTVTLSFAQPTTATGTLVLKKDNPSGLPQNDDSISIPVRF